MRSKKTESTPQTANDLYYQMVHASNSFVFKLDTVNDKIISEPDIKNKFLT